MTIRESARQQLDLDEVLDLLATPEGLYIAEGEIGGERVDSTDGPAGPPPACVGGTHRTRRLHWDGTVEQIAGTTGAPAGSLAGFERPGQSLNAPALCNPHGLALDRDGRLHFIMTASGHSGVFRADGDQVTHVLGSLAEEPPTHRLDDGDRPRNVGAFDEAIRPQVKLVLHPDGMLYLAHRRAWYGGNPPSAWTRFLRVRPEQPVWSPDHVFVPASSEGEVYEFDARGRHLATLDPRSGAHRLDFEYTQDGRGHLQFVRDRVQGRDLELVRDGSGRVTEIKVAGTTRLELVMGECNNSAGAGQLPCDGWLRSISESQGGRLWQYEYLPGGLLSRYVDPRGGIHRFEYDEHGRLTDDIGPGPGPGPGPGTPDDPVSVVKLQRTDGQSAFEVTVVRSADPALGSARHITEEYADGIRHVFHVGSDGRNTSTTRIEPDTRIVWAADGSRTRITEAPHPRWGWGMPLVKSLQHVDRFGRTLEIATTMTIETESSDGDSLPQVVWSSTTTTAGGQEHTQTVTRDVGQVGVPTLWTLTSDPPGPPGLETTVTSVDALGRSIQRRVGSLATTHNVFPFTAAGNPLPGPLTTVLQAAMDEDGGWHSRQTDFDYYPGGARLHSVDSQPAAGEHLATYFEYDAAGRVVSAGTAGQEVLTGYDESDNLLSVTPPGQPEHTSQVSMRGLEQAYTPPPVANTIADVTTTWDALRRPLVVTFGDSGQLSFVYDGRRLSRVDETAGELEESISYEYDPASGQVTSIEGPGSARLSAPISETPVRAETLSIGGAVGTVSTESDVRGRLQRRSVAIGEAPAIDVLYEYDDQQNGTGQLVSAAPLQNGTGQLDSVRSLQIVRDGPDNAGLVSAISVGQVGAEYDYNLFGELAHISAGGSSPSSRYEAEYSRDDLGRITGIGGTNLESPFEWSYVYDSAGRLWKETDATGVTWTNTYDGNGNRTSRTSRSAPTPEEPQGVLLSSTVATYDAQDRILTHGSATFEHNGAGQRIARIDAATTEYLYDLFGNLRRVDFADGRKIEYEVDGRGRRVGRKLFDANGALVSHVRWLYKDKLDPVAQVDVGGNEEPMIFVYGTSRFTPNLILKGGATYQVVTDHLGSVRLVVDATTGAVIQRIDYDAWGKITLPAAPEFQPFGFAGGLHDRETGFVRFGARDYDPETGRWTAKDPIRWGGGQGNLFVYVGNDPLNLTDPSGLAVYLCRRPVQGYGSLFHRYFFLSDSRKNYGFGPDEVPDTDWGTVMDGEEFDQDMSDGRCQNLYVDERKLREKLEKERLSYCDADGWRHYCRKYGEFKFNCIDWVQEMLQDIPALPAPPAPPAAPPMQ